MVAALLLPTYSPSPHHASRLLLAAGILSEQWTLANGCRQHHKLTAFIFSVPSVDNYNFLSKTDLEFHHFRAMALSVSEFSRAQTSRAWT